MTALLNRLLGRLPLGWLQLISNKFRFVAAAAGVGFACILVFVQLGMMGSFSEATRVTYRGFNADVMISSSDANDLSDGSNIARRGMFQALAVPGVSQACPLFIGMTQWLQADGSKIEFRTIGIDPGQQAFIASAIGEVAPLMLANNVFLDRHARGLKPDVLPTSRWTTPWCSKPMANNYLWLAPFTLAVDFQETGSCSSPTRHSYDFSLNVSPVHPIIFC